MFVTADEPTLMCDNPLKPTVYIRVHPWWCSCCGLRHVYRDTCPLLEGKHIFASQHPLSSTFSSLSLTPARTELLPESIALPFLQGHLVEIVAFSDWLLLLRKGLSLSFRSLISWFFLALSNTVLSECITVYLEPLGDIWVSWVHNFLPFIPPYVFFFLIISKDRS